MCKCPGGDIRWGRITQRDYHRGLWFKGMVVLGIVPRGMTAGGNSWGDLLGERMSALVGGDFPREESPPVGGGVELVPRG